MFKYKALDISGALLDERQLEIHLQKIAADQILKASSDKDTYPIPRLKDNIRFIYDVYNFLGEDLKNNIPIHPAGEWILDNFILLIRMRRL